MSIPVLKVETRTQRGKGAAAKLRQTGKIPAVCYGINTKTLALETESLELISILRGPLGLNSLIKLQGGEEERVVFVQKIQKHPVSRKIIHVDFINVDTSKTVQRNVPVELDGRPEGVKIGGVLQVTRREILVEALPTDIPDKILVNVEPLEIGHSLHVEELDLPKGVKALYDSNFTICAVVAPTEEKEPEEEVTEEEALALAEGEEGAEKPEGAEAEDSKDGEKAPADAAEEKKPKK